MMTLLRRESTKKISNMVIRKKGEISLTKAANLRRNLMKIKEIFTRNLMKIKEIIKKKRSLRKKEKTIIKKTAIKRTAIKKTAIMEKTPIRKTIIMEKTITRKVVIVITKKEVITREVTEKLIIITEKVIIITKGVVEVIEEEEVEEVVTIIIKGVDTKTKEILMVVKENIKVKRKTIRVVVKEMIMEAVMVENMEDRAMEAAKTTEESMAMTIMIKGTRISHTMIVRLIRLRHLLMTSCSQSWDEM